MLRAAGSLEIADRSLRLGHTWGRHVRLLHDAARPDGRRLRFLRPDHHRSRHLAHVGLDRLCAGTLAGFCRRRRSAAGSIGLDHGLTATIIAGGTCFGLRVHGVRSVRAHAADRLCVPAWRCDRRPQSREPASRQSVVRATARDRGSRASLGLAAGSMVFPAINRFPHIAVRLERRLSRTCRICRADHSAGRRSAIPGSPGEIWSQPGRRARADSERPRPEPSFSRQQALRTGVFWLLCAAGFLTNAVGTALLLNHFSIMQTAGVAYVDALTLLALAGGRSGRRHPRYRIPGGPLRTTTSRSAGDGHACARHPLCRRSVAASP